MSIPATVKTVLHNKADHTLSLQDHATPTPTPSQYLIKVHSTCFTAGELEWPESNAHSEPIPCFDLAGTVLAVPTEKPKSRVTKYWPVGTAVFGLTNFERHGNAREITVAEHDEIIPLLEGIVFSAAATVPLSALTAMQALFEHAGLTAGPRDGKTKNAGKRLLVTAAAGGVGLWLVQLAAFSGIHVTGTCSAKNVELVKSLGAGEVLDYNTTDLVDWVGDDKSRQFDVVIDCVGGKTLEQCWTVVKNGGILTSITQGVKPDPERPESVPKNKEVRTFYFIVTQNHAQLGMLSAWLESGAIKPRIDSVWPLNEYQNAWDKVNGGHVSGKVVLQVSE